MDEAFELLDGPPDVLVTSTGEVIQKWFEDIAAYEWQSMFDDNFFSHVYLAQEFVRRTIEDEWRKYIVVVSSMSGTGYMNGSMPYCTAKAACNMLVKGMAWELAPKNYLVSGVAPNSLENSEMVHQIRRELTKFRGLTPQQAFEYWSAGQLLPKRMLTDDVAKMVGVLVSGEWDFMAGEVMEARMATR
jgi:NAD(P)-dependent dehydrogenase (short-subunit alcohol dehydrogenase family)